MIIRFISWTGLLVLFFYYLHISIKAKKYGYLPFRLHAGMTAFSLFVGILLLLYLNNDTSILTQAFPVSFMGERSFFLLFRALYYGTLASFWVTVICYYYSSLRYIFVKSQQQQTLIDRIGTRTS